ELTRSKEEQEAERLKGDAIDRLVAENSFEVPDSLVDRYYESVKKRFDELNKERKHSPEMTPELEGKCREVAVLHAKRDLIIDWIADKEEIEVTNEDVEVSVKKMAEQTGEEPDRVIARLMKDGQMELIRAGLRDDKVFALMIAEDKDKK
ncbi:MAG: hypothetical protein V3T30_03270, partial [Thermodesulfobacteriota bacterium]